jgi:hypothetical protein
LPFEATLQVYQAKPGVKRLWLMPGVGHAQEPVLAQDAEYTAQLREFFHSALPTQTSSCVGAPPITCDLLAPPAGAATVQLRNAGSPGLVLLTSVYDKRLEFRTVWLSDGVDLPHMGSDAPRQVSCLRLFTGTGCGATARLCPSARGQRYQEVYQPYMRGLSRLLHEGRLQELDDLLAALPQERPEAPFDFFLGLYCVQIMRQTQRKLPHIARAAAAAFCRYWPSSRPAAPGQRSTPRDLAAAVLSTRT